MLIGLLAASGAAADPASPVHNVELRFTLLGVPAQPRPGKPILRTRRVEIQTRAEGTFFFESEWDMGDPLRTQGPVRTTGALRRATPIGSRSQVTVDAGTYFIVAMFDHPGAEEHISITFKDGVCRADVQHKRKPGASWELTNRRTGEKVRLAELKLSQITCRMPALVS
jgi:hypothetical protein